MIANIDIVESVRTYIVKTSMYSPSNTGIQSYGFLWDFFSLCVLNIPYFSCQYPPPWDYKPDIWSDCFKITSWCYQSQIFIPFASKWCFVIQSAPANAVCLCRVFRMKHIAVPATMKLNEYKVNGISSVMLCLIIGSSKSNRKGIHILGPFSISCLE